MFIVSITYTAPGPEIAAQRPAHIRWLKDAFAKGNFKIAGSKTTKDGGILLTDHPDRKSLEAELDLDPYRIHNVASHTVIGFEASMTA